MAQAQQNNSEKERKRDKNAIETKGNLNDYGNDDNTQQRANAKKQKSHGSGLDKWVSVSFCGRKVRYSKSTFTNFPECVLSKMLIGHQITAHDNDANVSYCPVWKPDTDEEGYTLVDLEYDLVEPIIKFMKYHQHVDGECIQYPARVQRRDAVAVCRYLDMETYLYSLSHAEYPRCSHRDEAFYYINVCARVLRSLFRVALCDRDTQTCIFDKRIIMLCTDYVDDIVRTFSAQMHIPRNDSNYDKYDAHPNSDYDQSDALTWLWNEDYTTVPYFKLKSEAYNKSVHALWKDASELFAWIKKSYSINSVRLWALFHTLYDAVARSAVRRRVMDTPDMEHTPHMRVVLLKYDVGNFNEWKHNCGPLDHDLFVFVYLTRICVPHRGSSMNLADFCSDFGTLWALTNMSDELILEAYHGLFKPVCDIADQIPE